MANKQTEPDQNQITEIARKECARLFHHIRGSTPVYAFANLNRGV